MNLLKPNSTRALLTLTIIVPLFTLGAVMMVYVSIATQRWAERDLEQAFEAVAAVLAARIEVVDTLDRPHEMAALNASLSAISSVFRVLYINENGQVGRWQFARTGLSGVTEDPAQAGPHQILRRFSINELLGESGYKGQIIFLGSTASAERRTRQVLWEIAAIGVLGALLSGLIARLVAKRHTSSVERLERAVIKVVQNRDYGARLPAFDQREFASLASGVQQLMSVVQEGIEELDSEMRRSTQATSLAESDRNRLAMVMEAMPIGLALISGSGRLSYFNPTLGNLFGVDESKLRGIDADEFIEQLSGGIDTVKQGIRSALEYDDVTSMRGFSEFSLNGDTVLAGTSVRISREEEEERLLLVRDVSSEYRSKKLEEGLHQAQKMESVGQLASAVSHDFNNILTAIMGFGQLALLGTAPNDPTTKRIESILDAADSARLVVEKLLLLSQRRTSAPTVVDVATILESQRGMLAQLLPMINLSLKMEGGPFWVLMDPTDFERVIVNLAVNAGDAMPEGSRLAIDAQWRKSQRGEPELALYFEDTGTDIPEDKLEQVMEPFFTTKELGAGTGLGLSTVKSIIDQTGGELTIESSVGQGTKITIHLPLVVTNPAQAITVPSNKPDKQSESIHSIRKVLLVEDSAMVRSTTSKLLRSLGFYVAETCNGAEALAFLKGNTEHFDLLLSDVLMPGMRGREVAYRVKTIRPAIHVLLMSGFDDEMVAPDSEQARYPLLRKPFTQAQLSSAINAAIEEQS